MISALPERKIQGLSTSTARLSYLSSQIYPVRSIQSENSPHGEPDGNPSTEPTSVDDEADTEIYQRCRRARHSVRNALKREHRHTARPQPIGKKQRRAARNYNLRPMKPATTVLPLVASDNENAPPSSAGPAPLIPVVITGPKYRPLSPPFMPLLSAVPVR